MKGQLLPMQPIICSEPMELVHIDYVGMEVTVATNKKPVVRNVLMVMVCAGFHDQKPYGEDNSQSAVQQLFLSIQFPSMPYVGSGNRILWKSHCGDV